MEFNESVYKLTGKIYLKNPVQKNLISPVLEITVPHGFVINPYLQKYLDLEETKELMKYLSQCSASYSDWTRTFFKNWRQIEKQTDFSFAFHQVVHYLSVYYYDSRILDSDEVYIPNTEITNFSMKELLKAPLKVLKLISKEEVEETIINLISSGIALSQETLDNIFQAAREVGINPILFLKNSKNREFSCLVRKTFNILPDHPLDFLRQAVYIATGRTLLIKDKDTIEAIKNSKEVKDWLNSYCIQTKGSMVEMSKYFYRFKPLILAMKDKRTAEHINRIRRLAKKNHVPMEKDFLSSITEMIKLHEEIDFKRLEEELKKATIFRAFSLLKSIQNLYSENKVYRVRNGKVWAEKNSEDSHKFYLSSNDVFKVIRDSILERIDENVSEKKIYLPKNITYAVPTSEKDFVGFIPCGSYVTIDSDKSALIGVHWENRKDAKNDSWRGNRVDLDLSMNSLTEKIGWDRSYRNTNLGIWFSGDITDAPPPHGATEFFRINGKNDLVYSVNLHSYTQNEVGYDLIIGEMDSEEKGRVFVPSAKIFQYQSSIDNSKDLGIYIQKDGKKRFYFKNLQTSEGRTSKAAEYKKIIIEKSLEDLDNQLTLDWILKRTTAILVDNPSEADIDLSVDKLSSDSIIKLFI
jgi:hypothetical protein